MSTTDPLLSSLCQICNYQSPKYKCPRCDLRSCSLKCAQLHKKRAQCSGVRDVAKVSRSELFTPTGLNNDYNFITGIERKIERADRIFIHEKEIIPRRSERGPRNIRPKRKIPYGGKEDGKKPDGAQLFDPENDRNFQKMRKNTAINRVTNKIRESGVILKQAPAGMQRSKDNWTSISGHKSRNLVWQVEWITDDGAHRLDKLVDTEPLGSGYEQVLNKRERAEMNEEERTSSKKRKAADVHRANVKRQRLGHTGPISASYLQRKNSRWNFPSTECFIPGQLRKHVEVPPFQSPFYFYLFRPLTPSSKPKVLIPLDSSKPLSKLLRGRIVVEFPTIYVSTKKPKDMAKSFMMEKDFLASVGKGNGKRKSKEKGKGLVEYSDSESESNSGSNSGSDTDSDADSDSAHNTDSDSEGEEEEGSEDSVGEGEGEGEISWSESLSETSDEDDEDTAMVDS